MSADANEKGTAWKPQVLRTLKMVQESCGKLQKSCYDAGGGNSGNVWVRFTMADAESKNHEVEFDVSGEYKKWLMANKQRKAVKDARG